MRRDRSSARADRAARPVTGSWRGTRSTTPRAPASIGWGSTAAPTPTDRTARTRTPRATAAPRWATSPSRCSVVSPHTIDEGFWNVSVYPTDPSRTEKVEITAVATAESLEEAAEKLPSAETLTDLGLSTSGWCRPSCDEPKADHEEHRFGPPSRCFSWSRPGRGAHSTSPDRRALRRVRATPALGNPEAGRMSRDEHKAEFEEFVLVSWRRLGKAAYALTGNKDDAEDLLQSVLERTCARWSKIVHENPHAYVRRALVHGYVDGWRRKRRVRVDPTDTVPDTALLGGRAGMDGVEDRLDLTAPAGGAERPGAGDGGAALLPRLLRAGGRCRARLLGRHRQEHLLAGLAAPPGSRCLDRREHLMSDIDVHEEFDRLDTGISDHPDLAGLWAGGPRRRRRTRAIWTAGALATAAVVAPLALLVGGGVRQRTDDARLRLRADRRDDARSLRLPTLTAVVTRVSSPMRSRRPPAARSRWRAARSSRSSMGDSPEGSMLRALRRRGRAVPNDWWATDSCVSRHEDRDPSRVQDGPRLSRSATTSPAVEVIVRVTSTAATAAEGEAQLPSDETLSDLAVDERLPLLFTGGSDPEPAAATNDEDSRFDAMRAAVFEAFPLGRRLLRGHRARATSRTSRSMAHGLYLADHRRSAAQRLQPGERRATPLPRRVGANRSATEIVVRGRRGTGRDPGHSGAVGQDGPGLPDGRRAHRHAWRSPRPCRPPLARRPRRKLPSVETLTELALDERLAPTTE